MDFTCVGCPKNETWKTSGYECKTCENPDAKCDPTNQAKCYCDDHFIYSEVLETCILLKDCPQSGKKILCQS